MFAEGEERAALPPAPHLKFPPAQAIIHLQAHLCLIMREREQQGCDLQEIMVYYNSELMFIVLAMSPVGKDNTAVSSHSTGALSIE